MQSFSSLPNPFLYKDETYLLTQRILEEDNYPELGDDIGYALKHAHPLTLLEIALALDFERHTIAYQFYEKAAEQFYRLRITSEQDARKLLQEHIRKKVFLPKKLTNIKFDNLFDKQNKLFKLFKLNPFNLNKVNLATYKKTITKYETAILTRAPLIHLIIILYKNKMRNLSADREEIMLDLELELQKNQLLPINKHPSISKYKVSLAQKRMRKINSLLPRTSDIKAIYQRPLFKAKRKSEQKVEQELEIKRESLPNKARPALPPLLISYSLYSLGTLFAEKAEELFYCRRRDPDNEEYLFLTHLESYFKLVVEAAFHGDSIAIFQLGAFRKFQKLLEQVFENFNTHLFISEYIKQRLGTTLTSPQEFWERAAFLGSQTAFKNLAIFEQDPIQKAAYLKNAGTIDIPDTHFYSSCSHFAFKRDDKYLIFDRVIGFLLKSTLPLPQQANPTMKQPLKKQKEEKKLLVDDKPKIPEEKVEQKTTNQQLKSNQVIRKRIYSDIAPLENASSIFDRYREEEKLRQFEKLKQTYQMGFSTLKNKNNELHTLANKIGSIFENPIPSLEQEWEVFQESKDPVKLKILIVNLQNAIETTQMNIQSCERLIEHQSFPVEIMSHKSRLRYYADDDNSSSVISSDSIITAEPIESKRPAKISSYSSSSSITVVLKGKGIETTESSLQPQFTFDETKDILFQAYQQIRICFSKLSAEEKAITECPQLLQQEWRLRYLLVIFSVSLERCYRRSPESILTLSEKEIQTFRLICCHSEGLIQTDRADLIRSAEILIDIMPFHFREMKKPNIHNKLPAFSKEILETLPKNATKNQFSLISLYQRYQNNFLRKEHRSLTFKQCLEKLRLLLPKIQSLINLGQSHDALLGLFAACGEGISDTLSKRHPFLRHCRNIRNKMGHSPEVFSISSLTSNDFNALCHLVNSGKIKTWLNNTETSVSSFISSKPTRRLIFHAGHIFWELLPADKAFISDSSSNSMTSSKI